MKHRPLSPVCYEQLSMYSWWKHMIYLFNKIHW